MPPAMPTELHVDTTRIRRTSGRRPVSFKQSKDLSHIAVCVGQCVSLGRAMRGAAVGHVATAIRGVPWSDTCERANEMCRAWCAGVRTDTARSCMLSAASAKCTERLSGNVKKETIWKT